MTEPSRAEIAALFRDAQSAFCNALEGEDGGATFETDRWERPDAKGQFGGGGITRVLRRGAVFEQAGVNFSEVHGTLPPEMTERLTGTRGEAQFYATGISTVIHPTSPLVPTTHANVRYLEVEGMRWFGGGADLTPYYLFEEDARHFHQTLRNVCDRHSPSYYRNFKAQCDTYFYLPHRKECRGIGGIFFDYLGKDGTPPLHTIVPFARDLALSLSDLYLPIVARRKGAPWSDAQKQFQLIRRGRYVEFNLLYDRGTLFGLKTDGRIESILMSLPPAVCWEYAYAPEAGSMEAQLIDILRNPREWVG